ncbi:MAG: LLM class flavin-dependent oxidoreductase, partial [Ktedonobacteraceae bacterium]
LYDSYDPLISLAAAAAVTRRVRLATSIIIGPLRDTAVLAKEVASLDAISGGRLVLGLAVGARKDDYAAAGIEYHTRGRRFSEQLGALHSLWEDATLSQTAGRRSGPELLVGGLSDQSFARMTRYADGYIHGGGPPKAFARAADKARAAWSDAGRTGRPLLWAHGYFALGAEHTIETGARNLKDYYAFTGPFAAKVAAGMLTSPQALAQFVRGYEEAGCDELILFPAVADLAQLTALATILTDLGRQPQRTAIDQWESAQ